MASFFTYAQLRRSWYTFFFQSPLAELAVPMDDFVFIDHLWADWSPGYDAAFDLARVKESIGDPEHIAAAIGYYRALYDSDRHSPDLAATPAWVGRCPGSTPARAQAAEVMPRNLVVVSRPRASPL